jgi:hypothetical protein
VEWGAPGKVAREVPEIAAGRESTMSSLVSGITSGFYLQMEEPEIDVSAPESSEVATNKVETELLESVGAGPQPGQV